MIEEIIKILKKYHDEKKYADDDFVINITNIIVNYNGLHDYIKGIIIEKDINGDSNRYFFSQNLIKFNLLRLSNKKDYKNLQGNYYGMFNLDVVKTIFHELEHVRQEKIKDSDHDSIESKLLILGDPLTYLKIPESEENNFFQKKYYKHKWRQYYKYYDFYYPKVPAERMAIIKSWKYVSQIIEKDFIKNSPYYQYVSEDNERDINKYLFVTYRLLNNITNSPSLEYLYYLFKDNRNIILTDKSFYNPDIPLEERILYGLSLSKNEYEETKKDKSILIKRNFLR